MNEGAPLLLLNALDLGKPLVYVSDEHDFSAVAARLLHAKPGRGRGHYNFGVGAEDLSGVGDGNRMVAGADRGDAALPVGLAQLQQPFTAPRGLNVPVF